MSHRRARTKALIEKKLALEEQVIAEVKGNWQVMSAPAERVVPRAENVITRSGDSRTECNGSFDDSGGRAAAVTATDTYSDARLNGDNASLAVGSSNPTSLPESYSVPQKSFANVSVGSGNPQTLPENGSVPQTSFAKISVESLNLKSPPESCSVPQKSFANPSLGYPNPKPPSDYAVPQKSFPPLWKSSSSKDISSVGNVSAQCSKVQSQQEHYSLQTDPVAAEMAERRRQQELQEKIKDLQAQLDAHKDLPDRIRALDDLRAQVEHNNERIRMLHLKGVKEMRLERRKSSTNNEAECKVDRPRPQGDIVMNPLDLDDEANQLRTEVKARQVEIDHLHADVEQGKEAVRLMHQRVSEAKQASCKVEAKLKQLQQR
eukprot:gnl/MRDRNA2_/MRDRNA2_66853_c0_seq1.p1 gnl/MRDRNA2_/MRDRNA2_66853_c0~~gnl/MRDRNA2_/MRDRNA2_66853_c0_seq1.p1  ORF type:complete len:376 (-),score=77.61 gnl/MRDRNA2_/MRDRNA2_66853_c0_seq1:135-1262(-)